MTGAGSCWAMATEAFLGEKLKEPGRSPHFCVLSLHPPTYIPIWYRIFAYTLRVGTVEHHTQSPKPPMTSLAILLPAAFDVFDGDDHLIPSGRQPQQELGDVLRFQESGLPWDGLLERSFMVRLPAIKKPLDTEGKFEIITVLWKWIRQSGSAEQLATVPPAALRMPKLGTQWKLGYCPLRRFLRDFPRKPDNDEVLHLLELQWSLRKLYHALTGSTIPCRDIMDEILEQELPQDPAREGAVDIDTAKFYAYKCFRYALGADPVSFSKLFTAKAIAAVHHSQQEIDLIEPRILHGSPEPAGTTDNARQVRVRISESPETGSTGVLSASPAESTPSPSGSIIDQLSDDDALVSDLFEFFPNFTIEVAPQAAPTEAAPNQALTAQNQQQQHGLTSTRAPRDETPATVQTIPTGPRGDRERAAAAPNHNNRGRNWRRGRGGYRGHRGGGGAGRNGRRYNHGRRNNAGSQVARQPAPRPEVPEAVYRRVVPAFMPAHFGESAMGEAAVSPAWDQPYRYQHNQSWNSEPYTSWNDEFEVYANGMVYFYTSGGLALEASLI